MWYVYILQSLKNSFYYVGFTNDPERRIFEHNSSLKKNSFTYKNRPYKMVHLEKYHSKIQAMLREKFLKTGKGREEIKKLSSD
ncbi:MAG: GIY-YIG nuclease family protein [Patescibacteria group bacterium]